MGDVAHFHLDTAVSFFNNRNMFFFGGIDRIFCKMSHGLTTADKLSCSSMEDFNNITTDITLKHFQFVWHNSPPFLVFFL